LVEGSEGRQYSKAAGHLASPNFPTGIGNSSRIAAWSEVFRDAAQPCRFATFRPCAYHPRMFPKFMHRRGAPASVWRDIAIALAVALLIGGISAVLEVHEALFVWSRRWEAIQLDEWPVAVFAFSVCLVLLYALRHRQLRTALEDNRRLSRHALAAQEDERRRLARELHDELGQYLNAIQLDARALTQGTSDVPQHEAAGRIGDNATHVYGVVSDLVRRLRPAALDELGLVAALEAFVDRARVLHPQLAVRLTFVGDWEGLSEALNLGIYRIVQESLTNCVRHARSRTLGIVLHRASAGGTLELQIEDEGVGLDPRVALAAGGGLAGMRERVQLLGGSFELLSQPGQGARIRILLPTSGTLA
jgi:two-component system sensor histidine kinase UhpB